MRSYLNRFATLGLVLGAGTTGCTVEQVDATPQGAASSVGGTSGTGGGAAGGVATGGAGGAATGGAGGTATGGGAGTVADATTDWSASDAQGECWGDETGLDAANLAAACDRLPYATTDCDGGVPPGVSNCLYIADKYRVGLFEGVYNCLAGLPTADVCAEAPADACLTEVNKQACPLTYAGLDTDSGLYNCAWLAQVDCPGDDAGAAGITEADCNTWMSWLSPAWRDQTFNCYLDATTPTVNPQTCAADFKSCAFP